MKRIHELKKLSEDHHLGLVLARRACIAAKGSSGRTPAQAWEDIEKKFQDELEPHFRIEEDCLLPHLEALNEMALVDRLRNEHKELRRIVNDRSSRSLSQLKDFGEKLERHIRFEERELFETIQERIAPALLKEVDEAWHTGRK